MNNLIGQSLDRYQITEKLGEGGMAIVYKALDTRLERFVAIKIIRQEKGASEKFTKRFQREAKTLATLNHKNIIPIIDYGEYEGIPYLVMPYIPGGTLKQKIGKPIPYNEAASILAPIASALAYAHSHGIVHRDIKPANILITEDGDPMLSDFGIAKILEMEETADLTGTGVGVGTPEYMSPEQTMGNTIDGRADEYSLGVVFYEMVTGRKPYTAETPLAVAIKQNTEPLPNPRLFNPTLPERVEQVILKSLSKKPENRYQSLDLFCNALLELSTGNFPKGKSKVTSKTTQKSWGASDQKRNHTTPTMLWISITAGILFILGITGIVLNKKGIITIEPLLSPKNTSTAIIVQTDTKMPTTTAATSTPNTITISNPRIPILTPDFLSNSEVTYYQNFSTIPSDWDLGSSTKINDNIMHLNGNNYMGGIYNPNTLEDQEGIIVAFRCSTETEAEIFLQTGKWVTQGMRRWGIYCNSKASNWIEPDNYQDLGSFVPGTFHGNLTFSPDTWYALLLTIGGSEEFIARIWKPDDPNTYLELRQVMGSDWDNRIWNMEVGAATGSIEITNYQELNLQTSIDPPSSSPTASAPLESFTVGSTQTLQDGMEMVFVPAGEFLMGSKDGVGDADEHPQHIVTLDAFWIDKTEVTNAMYKKCIEAGGCTERNYRYDDQLNDQVFVDYPVVYVTHDESAQYCKWAGKRLPTEAEWEKSAAGIDGSLYPWGDSLPDASLANFNNNIGNTLNVGSYPDGASYYGALDMAGNVWEWVSDKYSPNYYESSPASNPQGGSASNLYQYALRGGSFVSNFVATRSSERSMNANESREDIGFRCVISAK